MLDQFLYPCVLVILFFLELLYFRIAAANNILDKPNGRSSHSNITIRGGGIIFLVAVILWFFLNPSQYPLFFFGLLLIAGVSFIDDIRTLNNKIRIGIHVLSVFMLLYQVYLITPELSDSMTLYSLFFILCSLILIIGTINAWNFMDGINGITGGYSLITLGTLYYLNQAYSFTEDDLLLAVIASLIVFSFFNFRKKARCFAGDVGSVSIAFIICFLMLLVISQTGNFLFIGLLLLYGLDTVTTIIFRLIRKENIFEAHRSHFYQYLANEKGWSHLSVAGLYALIQGSLNIILIITVNPQSVGSDNILPLLLLCTISGGVFIVIRFITEGKARLLGK